MGARSNYLDNFPLDDSLCLLRVFHLLANGYLMPCPDKLGDIGICRKVRDPAHRDLVFLVLVPACKGDLEDT